MTDDDTSDEPDDPFEEFVTLTPEDSSPDDTADASPEDAEESGSNGDQASDSDEDDGSAPSEPEGPDEPDSGRSGGFFSPPEDPHSRMEWALLRIRFEGWKAASIHAVVDAAAVFLASNLVLTVLNPPWVPERVAIPAVLLGPADAVVGLPESVFLPGTAFLTGGLGILVFTVGLWLRVTQPLVEQFEQANPSVAEALRTARDAAASGDNSRMATRLYEDVLDQLRETSSVRLIDERRVGATILLVIVMSMLTIQVSVFGFTFGPDSAQASSGPDDTELEEFAGLRDGSDVLGDREDVSAGDENLTAQIDSTGGQEQVEDSSQFPSGGGPSVDNTGGTGGVGGQQAGFSAPDQIEDAELIREYNIRIRENTEEN